MRPMLRAALGFALFLAACNKGTDSEGGGGSGPMTARIDGKAWVSGGMYALCTAMPSPGGLLIQGGQTEGDANTSIVITLYNVSAPGTYPLGVGPSIYGGIASIGASYGAGKTDTWVSPMTGLDGTITFTKVGADGVAGTFAFTANPAGGTTGAARLVTDGKFDLPLKGILAPVPDNAGSRVSARLNGKPFNASGVTTMTAAQLGGAGLQFAGLTASHSVSVMIMGITGPGTYRLKDFDPVRVMGAGMAGSADCCWGPTGTKQDSGTVVVTSLTASRAKGTFTATLSPQSGAATAPLVITEGEFDVGIK